MSEKDTPATLVSEGKALVKPIYEDAAQSTLREVSTVVSSITRAALSPVRILASLANERADMLEASLLERLRGTPKNELVDPPGHVALPALLGIAANQDEDLLRNMYLDLLAASMDRRRAGEVHPAYVKLVGEMSPSDALLLKSVSNGVPGFNAFVVHRSNGEMVSSYRGAPFFLLDTSTASWRSVNRSVENLVRLGLFTTDHELRYPRDHYDELRDSETVKAAAHDLQCDAVMVAPTLKQGLSRLRYEEPDHWMILCRTALHPTSMGRSLGKLLSLEVPEPPSSES